MRKLLPKVSFPARPRRNTNITLLHAIGSALALAVPFHDGARTIENQTSSADVRQHPAFGFLPDPLEAGAALLVPQDFKKPFCRHPLVQFREGRTNRRERRRHPWLPRTVLLDTLYSFCHRLAKPSGFLVSPRIVSAYKKTEHSRVEFVPAIGRLLKRLEGIAATARVADKPLSAIPVHNSLSLDMFAPCVRALGQVSRGAPPQ